ncbi:MAG: 4-hydroxy-tetrahydrodipicolinate reductase [Parvularcula sp.]
MIRLVVAGATGQTGAVVSRLARASDEFDLLLGIGRAVNMSGDVPTARHVRDAPPADVVIDFSTPEACVDVVADCVARDLPLVTGTTGLSDAQQGLIRDAAEKIAIVQSGNFSLGINALLALAEKASALFDGFDIEVSETHHRNKIDSPSGTALMLGEAAARGAGTALMERAVFSRHGQVGPRKDGEIGFSVRRGGGVVGDHEVAFLSDSEVVTLSHRAIDRSLFAEGALHAAAWVKGRPPGLYTMQDVLQTG